MKYFLSAILLTLLSCSSTNNFYHGRVTGFDNTPLENVTVLELYRNNQTKTDKNGYFNFKRYSSDFLGDLVFIKKGYNNDTIPTVWHQAGETTEYNFVENDTTVVKLKKTVDKEILN